MVESLVLSTFVVFVVKRFAHPIQIQGTSVVEAIKPTDKFSGDQRPKFYQFNLK